MIASGVLFLSICLKIDYHIFAMMKYKLTKETLKAPPIRPDIDDDVKNEIDKVKALTTPQIEQRNLVLRGITKFYDKLLAVNQIHLEVDSSECFGLIGVNVKLSNNLIRSNFKSFLSLRELARQRPSK